MLHVYRQITGCRSFESVVFCQKRENAADFPFPRVIRMRKPLTHQLRRFWAKRVRDIPIQIYQSEARRLAAALQEAQAELLHVYFGHIGVHLLPFIRRRRLPVIVSFHGADAMVDQGKPAYRSATREMLREVDLILVRSDSLAQRLIEQGTDPEKIRRHRTGIPLDEFPFVPKDPPPDGAWHLVQACRLITKKGLPTTLRAFADFSRTYPGSRLTVAGEGPDEANLRRQAGELGISDQVSFAGFLPQPELRKLFAGAHLFVHPSETGPDGNQEGVPNSMLEAMATGLPVLATRHGGIPEAVESGRSGLLVSERDDAALAGAMRQLASEPDLYRSMSKEASDSVRRQFEQGAQIAVLEDCYREAIERFSQPDKRDGATSVPGLNTSSK